MKVIIHVLHIPQSCRCQHHEKVFTNSQYEREVDSLAMAHLEIDSWHYQQGSDVCWVYYVSVPKQR